MEPEIKRKSFNQVAIGILLLIICILMDVILQIIGKLQGFSFYYNPLGDIETIMGIVTIIVLFYVVAVYCNYKY
jgi:arginine exporter protein ArgO